MGAPSFKECIAADIHSTFLNKGEFAEERTIIYGGVTYDGPEHRGIPVTLMGPVEEEREQLKDDHVQGLHLITHTLYCAQEDLGGKLPEPGTSFQISAQTGGKFFRRYYVAASACEMGMLHIELEEIGEAFR